MGELRLTVGDGADEEDRGLVTYDDASGRAIINLYPRMSGDEWQFDWQARGRLPQRSDQADRAADGVTSAVTITRSAASSKGSRS